MALNSSTTTTPFHDRASTKLGGGLRSRQGLTPAAQNVGTAAARSQRAFGAAAGLKTAHGNVDRGLGKPIDVKKQNVGALRLRDVLIENSGVPKSAQKSKGLKKRQRGLKNVGGQESGGGGGFLTPAAPGPRDRAATHVQGKMRIFTDQSSVFSRRRRNVAPVRTTEAPPSVTVPPPNNTSEKEQSGETSSDDMELTDNESCTIQRPMRNTRRISPPPNRAKSPSLKESAVHFDQTRDIWEQASSPSRGGDNDGNVVAPIVSRIVAPSLPSFDDTENNPNFRNGGGPGGLVAAPGTITALNKTKSITAAYTTAVNRALSPKTSATNSNTHTSQARSARLVAARRSLRGVGGTTLSGGGGGAGIPSNRVRTRVSALNTSNTTGAGASAGGGQRTPFSPTRSPTRPKFTRPLKSSRFGHTLKRGSGGGANNRHRRRASQQSSRSDCSDDSVWEPEFVYPMPGSDAEKILKQAIQGASVYEGFDKEEIETLTKLKRLMSELVAPSLCAYDIPEEELERLLTDYSTTSTATTWSTRTVDTEDPAFYEDESDDDQQQEYRAYADVPEVKFLSGSTENLNIEFSGRQEDAVVAN